MNSFGRNNKLFKRIVLNKVMLTEKKIKSIIMMFKFKILKCHKMQARIMKNKNSTQNIT